MLECAFSRRRLLGRATSALVISSSHPYRNGRSNNDGDPPTSQLFSMMTVVDLMTAVAWSPGLRSSSSAASRDISETIR
jgi:hypothetical protein